MKDVIARPAFSEPIAFFRSLRVTDVLKMLAPAAVIGLVVFLLTRDGYALIVVAFLCLIALPRQLARIVVYKFEIRDQDQLDRTIDLLGKTYAYKRDAGSLRWTLHHWPVWLQGRADEITITETGDGWTVFGPRLTMRSLATKLNVT